jgi:hypothetical protein
VSGSCTGPSIGSWSTPAQWDLDPNNPDYWVVSGSVWFVTGSYEVDRYGQWYISVGASVDILASFFQIPNVSVRAGDINGYGGIYQEFPDAAGMEAFLTGVSANAGGGILGGGSETWVPFAGEYVSHTSNEWGAYFPGSAGASVSFAWSGSQITREGEYISSVLLGSSP